MEERGASVRAPTIKGCFRWWVRREGKLLYEDATPNLIVSAAKPYLGDLLRGDKTKLVVMAVGTSATAPAAGDTQLGAETARLSLPAVGTDTALLRNVRSGNVVYLRVSFTGLATTLRESALFGNIASPPGAANSGSIFNHAAIGPIVLIGSDTYTLESQLTFN